MDERTLTSRYAYLSDVLKVQYGNEARYLHVMEKYSVEWWKSCEPAVIAERQLNDELLLVPFKRLQDSLESVLGRPVNYNEICYGNEAIKEEVKLALNRAKQ